MLSPGKTKLLNGRIGDRRCDNDAVADVDADMRRRRTLGHVDNLSLELIAGTEFHNVSLPCRPGAKYTLKYSEGERWGPSQKHALTRRRLKHPLYSIEYNECRMASLRGKGRFDRFSRRWRSRDQLNLMSAAFTKARLMAISRLIRASNSAGVSGIGSIPCGANFSCTLASCSAFCVSRWSRSTMSRGVFAGTSMPFQKV